MGSRRKTTPPFSYRYIQRPAFRRGRLQAGLRRGIYERNHKPFATFDGDQTDPTTFSPAQFETRVQALRENMEAAKAERGGP